MEATQDDQPEDFDAMAISPASSPRHAPWVECVLEAAEAPHSDLLIFKEPLGVLAGALVQQPSSALPLINHFLATIKPAQNSPVLSLLARSATAFLMDSNEDFDFTRARETQWYFAWLKDVVRVLSCSPLFSTTRRD